MGVYTGDRLNQISFPLGGIGTGCIGLAGSGRLIDWEIFNRPNKGSINGYSHFAVKAERDGQVLDARVLNGDLTTDHSGELRGGAHSADQFGFGPSRGRMAGAPHMDDVVFTGEFPISHLAFASGSFPGAVEMAAFNPFIPLNEDDSSIPAALFEIRVRNTGPATTRYTVAVSLSNPAGLGDTALYSRRGRRHLCAEAEAAGRAGGGRSRVRRSVRGHRRGCGRRRPRGRRHRSRSSGCRRGVGPGVLVSRRMVRRP